MKLQVASASKEEIERIVNFEEHNPESILGPHMTEIASKPIVSIRAYLPRAVKAWVHPSLDRKVEMTRVHKAGFFEAQLADQKRPIFYRIVFVDNTGYVEERQDPYSYAPVLSDYDIHLIGEGTHIRSYEKLGAHLIDRGGVDGTQFSVWAPNARSVCVVGNSNHWKMGAHPMTVRGSSGIWELFIPGIGESEVYKFGIKSNITGKIFLKTDPYAFQTELRPHTGAIVNRVNSHLWHDGEWVDRKA